MKKNNYKILAVSTEKSLNIGDYVQALASKQFLPSFHGFIEREELKEYNGDECNMIMNGWYMHDPSQWPPSNKIKPLFLAFHINASVEEQMLSPNSIAYLKQYEPIGCRDRRTCNLLLQNNIDAYYSGCMTLTLGYKYKTTDCDGKYFFVDAYAELPKGLKSILKSILHLFLHPTKVACIIKKYPKQTQHLYGKILKASYFHYEYSKLFSQDILNNAYYICQQSPQYKETYKTNEALLDCAENLVKTYAKAKLVVTSRIHCALPCLGLETPVLYIHNKQGNKLDDCRLEGILDLFNVIEWENGHLKRPIFLKDAKINKNTIITNKENWRQIANNLIIKCKNWIKICETNRNE